MGRIVSEGNNPGGSIREEGILMEGTEGRIEVGWETFGQKPKKQKFAANLFISYATRRLQTF